MVQTLKNTTAAAVVKTVLVLAFLALGGYYFWIKREEILALEWPSAFALIVVSVAFVVNIALRAAYNLLTARHLGTRISVGESFMLSAVVAAGNLLLPVKAGAGLRALYMKKIHNFPVSYFASSSLVFMVITMFVVSIFALLLVVLIYIEIGYFRLDLSILFPIVAIVMVASVITLRPSWRSTSDESWLAAFRGSLFSILRRRSLVAMSLVIAGLVFVSSSVAWTVAIREFAPGTLSLEAFLVAASQIISGFITLTPGAIGFQEVAGLYVGRSFAASSAEIFAALVWVRLVRVAVSIVVAAPSAFVLRSRTSELDRDEVAAS